MIFCHCCGNVEWPHYLSHNVAPELHISQAESEPCESRRVVESKRRKKDNSDVATNVNFGVGLRASPPGISTCCVKGSWQALWRCLAEKSAPSLLPGLFKLPAPLTILPGERCSCCAQIPGPHPLAIYESCHFWVEATLQGIFLTLFRVEEPVCKVRVGECHPKKI